MSRLKEKNIGIFINELAKLRGAALKIGQLLSLEANDFLPEKFSAMLGELRNKNFHMPNYQLGEVLRESYGDNFLDKFSYFSETPIAAASIGQVHKCHYGGKDLILKIQYPKIKPPKPKIKDLGSKSKIFQNMRDTQETLK